MVTHRTGQAHRNDLRHGTIKETGAKGVIDHADHRVRARVYHRHRMQQGRYRGGRHGSRRQPGIHGEDRSLGTKANEGQQEHQPQHHLMPNNLAHVQHTAQHKVRADAVVHDEDQRNEGQSRTADREDQVLASGADALHILLMGHQGQRNHGQAFVEHIQGEQIARQRHRQGYTIAHGVVGEEGIGPVLMAHVLKTVQGGQGPQKAHQAGKHLAHAIQVQRQGQGIGHPQQGQFPLGA